ncbi:ATP-dependent chaperone ClpB, partial [Aduncisulcus paluster]
MDPNKFTQKTNDAIAAAQSLAVKNAGKGIVSKILEKSSINPADYKKAVEDEIRKLPRVSGPGAQPGQVFVTQRLNRIIVASEEIAQRMQDEFISVEHLFLAIMDEHGST